MFERAVAFKSKTPNWVTEFWDASFMTMYHSPTMLADTFVFSRETLNLNRISYSLEEQRRNRGTGRNIENFMENTNTKQEFAWRSTDVQKDWVQLIGDLIG